MYDQTLQALQSKPLKSNINPSVKIRSKSIKIDH